MQRAIGRFSTSLLIVLIAALCAAAWGVVTGQWRAHTVLSGSMEPSLPIGSIAITERVKTSSLHVGDVITFREPNDPGHLVTHRITSIRTEAGRIHYETKGDANDFEDPWTVTLRGQSSYRLQTSVPYAGYIVTAVRDPAVRPWLLGGAAALMFLALLNLFLPEGWLHGNRRSAQRPGVGLCAQRAHTPRTNEKEMAP